MFGFSRKTAEKTDNIIDTTVRDIKLWYVDLLIKIDCMGDEEQFVF